MAIGSSVSIGFRESVVESGVCHAAVVQVISVPLAIVHIDFHLFQCHLTDAYRPVVHEVVIRVVDAKIVGIVC